MSVYVCAPQHEWGGPIFQDGALFYRVGYLGSHSDHQAEGKYPCAVNQPTGHASLISGMMGSLSHFLFSSPNQLTLTIQKFLMLVHPIIGVDYNMELS